MRAASLFALAVVLSSTGALADAATTKACTESFEKVQYLQKDNKLRAAREQAAVCARDACPKFVRDECNKWLADIDASQPTVVISAHDDKGADLADVKVDVDNELLQAQLTGTSVAIDPGPHTLRFTRAGQPPIEQKVVIRVTEKNRIVKVDFPAAVAASTTPSDSSASPGSARGPLWPGLVVAGVGVAAIGASIGIGLVASSDADNLRNTCAPRCSHDAVSAVDTKVIISDVLLGVGVVAAGVAVWMLIARPGGHEARTTAFHWVPTASGVRFAF